MKLVLYASKSSINKQLASLFQMKRGKNSEVIKHAIEANKAIDAIDTIIKQIDQTRH